MTLIRRVLIVIFALIVLLVLGAYLFLRASLPQLDGELSFVGLDAEVKIERDELGVATITAHSRTDAAFATGFLHGQERFFQMDLQRRAGAGELAALFGAGALELDRTNRLHRFRYRARQMLAEIPSSDVVLYSAYTAGVNAGLESLGARPFEYLLLGQKPEPWQDTDILLTVFSMFFELNDHNASRESELGALKELLTAEAYQWLIQSGTDWDAPIRGELIRATPIPDPAALDLRDLPPALFKAASRLEHSKPAAGSNSWAVSGTQTSDGHALLAGDMHLGHAVPNIWFRARLVVAEEDLDITGSTLPGVPLVISGSNGHVAWALTNSYGDWQDLIELEIDPANPEQYRTPSGWREFEEVIEPIVVKGNATVELAIRETIWGPVMDQDFRGRTRALRWLPHLPQASNAGIARFEQARNVEQAIAAANRVGAPPQNYVVADADGRIGWTIMGQIPRRVGFDPATPASWAGGAGWQGWTAPEDFPRIIDPPEGLIWTANARTVDGDWLRLLGEGDHPLGARPKQIRDGLRARSVLNIDEMLAIQLDDRALFLQRWRDLALRLLTEEIVAKRAGRGEMRKLIEEWGGHASVESAGYRLVRAFRLDTIATVTASLLAGTREQLPDFELNHHSQLERPVWQVIEERPAHLLPPAYVSWEDFLIAIVDSTIDYFDQFDGTLADRTWGERNTTQIVHPLTYGVPALSRWLNMPALALPGDSNMPRVQSPTFGASQRMAVSPGREATGYFHMPGGQSGHPLSPYYGAGHADWAAGIPAPFLPGNADHRLLLRPGL
ncbi:MAG: penicillin acylase family protein [Gammaproteobacteria bacterium]|nr:penicillin acylase family protein [Gammaproteobacteria bacterium]